MAAVAFFDLDKTIIAGSSALAFGRPFRREGLITRRAVLRSGCAQLLLLVSGADASTMESLRKRITALCAGWEVAQVRSIVEQALHATVGPLVYAEATALIAEHRAEGDAIVVLSASGTEVVAPVAVLIGADECRATRMRIVEGRYTGEIEYYCYGAEKARAAREIAAHRDVPLADCRAYSDSITDLPLLELVGRPTAVNPDRALRRVAAERGWPVLTFAAPVPLGRRLRPVGAGVAAALVLGVGVGVAVVLSARRPPGDRGDRRFGA